MLNGKAKKKKAILEAAITVFAEYGYHNAKMAKIAELAGVGAGSLYLYYKNKANILAQIFDYLWEELAQKQEKLADRTDLSAVEKLDGMVDLVFDMFASNASLALVYVIEKHVCYETEACFFSSKKHHEHPSHRKFMDICEAHILEAQEAGMFNPHINAKSFRHFVYGGIDHLILQWAQAPEDFPIDIIRQDVKILVKKGILISDRNVANPPLT
jgi:TetR/AcrR family fatty acid metabolism transcriptional regulator